MKNPAKKAIATPSKLEALNNKASVFLKPLSLYQKSLFWFGPSEEKKEKSNFKKWVSKNATVLDLVQKIFFVLVAIVLLFTKPIALLLFPISGLIVLHKEHLKFLSWYIKIFYLKRKFYADRAKLYKQGSLLLHFKVKLPKTYNTKKGKVIIWAQSPSIQAAIFNKKTKEDTLTSKEYIH